MAPFRLGAIAASWLAAVLLQYSWVNGVAGQACTGVVDALGLQGAASNLAGAAVVNICNDVEITASIGIERPVTFVGQCASPGCRIHAKQPADKTTVSLFKIGDDSGNVTFKNLWLDNGNAVDQYASSYGGAILASSGTNLMVDTVLFTNNRASYGGAIYAYGNATITNCVFVNNTAESRGGALYLDGVATTVRNSNFTQNSAGGGGAIGIYSGSFSTSIRGSLFLYNNATSSEGGAIFVESSPINVTIVGNTFANNTSYLKGGAIYDSSNYYTLISGNSFLQNYAPLGGAIATEGSYATVVSPNKFTANSADSLQGGAGIYVQQSPTDGSTNFCPAQPEGVIATGQGGVVNTSCTYANCNVNSPCDPAAICTIVGSAPTCTCPSGVDGSGWLCENRNSGLLAVGASNDFVVPPFVSLAPIQTASTSPSIPRTLAPVASPAPGASTRGASSDRHSSKTGLVAGLAVAGVAVILVAAAVLGFVLYRRKKRQRGLPLVKQDAEGKAFDADGSSAVSVMSGKEADADEALASSWRRFTYPELQQATNNFSKANLLGEGAFGKVYAATLANGTRLAIKQLKSGGKGVGEREFLAELGTLGRVRHRNLVSLRGYCVTQDECFLVLDYAANGNLDAALRHSTNVLDWETRLNIAVGAVRGLSYLHNDSEPSILHRDVKSANILLDSKMQAQVADFGLAKLLEEGQSHQSTHVRGTYGYVAPEYALNGQVTKKSDVYSFGVVLLELITGFRALEVTPDGGRKNLVDAVMRTLGRHQPLIILDPKLENNYPQEAASHLVSIAIACCSQDELRRPEMAEVLRELESLARGELGSGFKSSMEKPTEDGDGHWFGPMRSGSIAPGSSASDQSSYPSHSTWSAPSNVSGSDNNQLSINYQMSMLTEGR